MVHVSSVRFMGREFQRLKMLPIPIVHVLIAADGLAQEATKCLHGILTGQKVE